MPTELSERPEELVRQYIVDSLRTGEIQGYDPTQNDPTASDFLPVTNDWSARGTHYPIIVVQETDGPSVPNSGNTNFNGIQGDGSGNNQFVIYNITISCQATQSADLDGGQYRNNTKAKNLVDDLYTEVHHQIQNNITTAISDAIFTGITPPTVTRNTEQTDSGSTITWIQRQGTATLGVLNTP